MRPALLRVLEAIASDCGALNSAEPLGCELWARPFVWRDPTTIPPRRWLYQPHLVRGYVSVTLANGGVGKTSLVTREALAVATGKNLLGVEPSERARVWLWNGEDPDEEGERRIHAVMLQCGLTASDVEGWLFTGSGRDAELVIAEFGKDGARVLVPVVDALIAFIRENDIGAIFIDPFVSSHRVPENDNGAIDRVVKAWAQVAQETGCAVHLVHHTRKTNGREATAEDGRGASALYAAARHVRVLNTMSETEAKRFGIEAPKRRFYVRIDDGKANLAPPAEVAEWVRLIGVELGNADNVQTVVRWTAPDPMEDTTTADVRRVQETIRAGRANGDGWRADVQAKDAWVGHAVAEALGLDMTQDRDLGRVKQLLRKWLDTDALVRVFRVTNKKGKEAPFIEVGQWVEVGPPP